MDRYTCTGKYFILIFVLINKKQLLCSKFLRKAFITKRYILKIYDAPESIKKDNRQVLKRETDKRQACKN